MNELVTSKQSLHVGGEVAGRLHDLGADRQLVQEAIENREHPVWGKITAVLTECFVRVEEVIEKAKEKILEPIAELTVPKQPPFVVAEKFTKMNKEVKFWDFGANFLDWFGSLIEKEMDPMCVMVNRLRVKANDSEINPELGTHRVILASQFYWMLQQQPKGEKPNGTTSFLLVDGSWNIFRIPDKNGTERTVYARWDPWGDERGWVVCANSVEDSRRWRAGSQVVSRKLSVP